MGTRPHRATVSLRDALSVGQFVERFVDRREGGIEIGGFDRVRGHQIDRVAQRADQHVARPECRAQARAERGQIARIVRLYVEGDDGPRLPGIGNARSRGDARQSFSLARGKRGKPDWR